MSRGMLHHPERKMLLPSVIKFYALASLALGESSLSEISDHLVKRRHSWVGQTTRNKDKWVFRVEERAVDGVRFETTEVRVNMRDRAAADLVSLPRTSMSKSEADLLMCSSSS